MRKRRFQKGALRAIRQGTRKVWRLQWYDATGIRRSRTLGLCSQMSRRAAETARSQMMLAINESQNARQPDDELTLGKFIEQNYFKHKEAVWKESSKSTTTDRIKGHVVTPLGGILVSKASREQMQDLLDKKVKEGLGKSMLDHLRFDLRDIFSLAVADRIVDRNSAAMLQTPRVPDPAEKRVMTAAELVQGLCALERREALIWKLAGFAGLRPGEIFALRRKHAGPNYVEIEWRIYQGVIDTPKNRRSKRRAAISESLGQELRVWLEFIDGKPDAWLFPSEAGVTPVRPENLWRRSIGPRLEPLGLGWVNFQVLRRTQESLSHAQGVDPKVRGDQLGHGIGVGLDEYTVTTVAQRQTAVQTLEDSILQ